MSMGIIETLQAEIQALKERVTALEQLTKGSDDKIFHITPEQRKAARARLQAKRQKIRDDIIEMAKRDVTHLQRRMATHIVQTEGNKWFQDYVTKAEFIVNREKRTVVALVRLNDIFEESNKVVSRGIAKCHPDDCFNAHIGRAIALRRALGLEVPDEYLNAPQPTEVRVGDVVCGKYDDDSYYYNKYRRFTLTRECEDKNAFRYAEDPSDWICRDQIGKVIDDSRK